MKLIAVIIVMFMLFTGFKAMLLLEEEDSNLPDFKFPNFDIPIPEPGTSDGSLGGVLMAILSFIGETIAWLFQQLLNIFLLLFLILQIIFFVFTILFSPIPNAPFIVNFLLTTFTIIGMIVLIALIRGTDTS